MSRSDAMLSKVAVGDAITLYTFSDSDAKHADTITVIIQDKRALLIDTAYPEYAARVRDDLEQQGIKPEVVVLSHYHPDHVSGCAALPQCERYASEFYEYNYHNCQVWEPEFFYLRPKKLVRHADTLVFGGLELKFHHAPGHSKCGLFTELPGNILHVGDIIMIARDGKNSLPYIADGGGFKDHIKSLKLLEQLNPDAIVAPHGALVEGKENIRQHVENRVYYLEKTLESNGTRPLTQCLKSGISTYEFLDFHNTNIIRLL